MNRLYEINKIYNAANLGLYEDAAFYCFLSVAFATRKAGANARSLDTLDAAIRYALLAATSDKEDEKKLYFRRAVEEWREVAKKRTVGLDNYFAAVASVLGVIQWSIFKKVKVDVKNFSSLMRRARREFYEFCDCLDGNFDKIYRIDSSRAN